MIYSSFSETEGFPFDHYFESPSQFISAQAYWLAVLRGAIGFEEQDWQPVPGPGDLADEMYTGMVVAVESLSQRKGIRIHTASVAGKANLHLKEDLASAALLKGGEPELQDYASLLANGQLPALVTTPDEADRQARLEVAQTGGFEAGVEVRGFIDETAPDGIVDGEVLTIIAIISEDNETLARKALALFLDPGPALERVNSHFVPQME